MIRLRTTFDCRGHRGATLTEVLMAILVMSIGVVSVITLFPLAILRSVRASQLTNARILEENVEQIVRANPEALLGGVEWTPNTSYAANTPISVPVNGGRYPSPNRRFLTTGGGNSGTTSPTWSGTVPITDNTVSWNTLVTGPYVVDPLGFHFLDVQANRDFFGVLNDGMGGATPSAIRRLNCRGASVLAARWAEELFVLPDSWTTVVDEVPVGVTTGGTITVTFPGTVDLVNLQQDGLRVTFFSADMSQSAVRENHPPANNSITATGQTLQVSTTADPLNTALPASLVAAGIGRVRIEVPEKRYSWMLTIPSSADGAAPPVSCAVFFRRSFTSEEEHSFRAPTTSGGTAPDTTGARNVFPRPSDGSTVLGEIVWDSSEPTPLLREGNFLFDMTNGGWYQIRSLSPASSFAAGTAVTIEIDRPMVGNCKAVMFPQGLVHVFQLESSNTRSSQR